MYSRQRFFVIPSGVEESLDIMSEERKTLEERATMTDLERLRHSESHVLATEILRPAAARPRSETKSRQAVKRDG